MKLSEKITEDHFQQEVTSNQAIRMLTAELVDFSYSAAEINEALHTIKNLVKKEVVASLDSQIETFKTFLSHV